MSLFTMYGNVTLLSSLLTLSQAM